MDDIDSPAEGTPHVAEIDEQELLRVLHEEESDSATYYASDLAKAQTEAMDRYHARPYGNEVENRSSVVTHDIEDTINWIMPHLMRVITGSDDLISVDDDGLEDGDPSLETAGAYLRHVLFKDNPGETVLHDFIFDGLLQRIGVARVYWEDPEPSPPKVIEGLSLDEAATYVNDPRYEILAHEFGEGFDEQTLDAQPQQALEAPVMPGQDGGLMGNMPTPLQPAGDPTASITVSLQVRRRDVTGRVRIEVVPPEEFRISRRAKSLESADYHAWVTEAYVADLARDHKSKAYDLDPDGVSTIDDGNDTDIDSDERHIARFQDESESMRAMVRDPARRKVTLRVEYIRGDFDRDGVVELRRIKRVGNVILENDIVEDTEMVAWSPIRVSHRLIGRSLADTLIDIQRIRTALARRAMDSLQQTLAPRTFVSQNAIDADPDVVDRILDHDTGDVIPIKGNPREAIYQEVTPDVSAGAFAAIEYWDRRSEEASGVNRHAMGIQPQAITQTKGGIDMLQAAANSRVEQVARWAAMGIELMLSKALGLVVSHQDKARTIKVTGQRLVVDPRRWSDEMTVSVHVGMAAESREKKLGYLSLIAGKQEQIMQTAGFNNPIVTPKEYRATLSKMVTAMGFKRSTEFFKEIAPDWQPPEPGPDPKTVELQQKGELAKAEMEGKQQLATADLQANMQKQAAEVQGRQQIAEAEVAHKQKIAEIESAARERDAERNAAVQREIAQMKLQSETAIAAQRMAQERELALLRMEFEREMAMKRLAMGAAMGKSPDGGANEFRDGGRLDA